MGTETESRWPHQLRRKFRLVIFDWDGTAVPDRKTPMPRLIECLDRLLRRGVCCAIITGTNIGNLEAQCLGQLSPAARKNLLVCTNRGSEVFVAPSSRERGLRYRREATPKENRALDEAAERLRAWLGERGLETKIISGRLNRRKLDLIPLPEWEDPPKIAIGELSRAVRRRIEATRLGADGLQEILTRAVELARESGLEDPRVTSDVKHVEIGLSDKSDSLRWLERELVHSGEVDIEDILVAGDEFGTIAGVTGSDAWMQIPELAEAVFISVGVEPEGVPEGVLRVPGGPERFVELIEYQDWMHASGRNLFGSVVPTPNPSWLIEQEGFEPVEERSFESLFAMSNGYLGARGSTDLPIPGSQFDLYVSGVYDRKASGQPYSEREFIADRDRRDPYSELVPIPSPLRVSIRAAVGREDVELSPAGPKLIEHERILDMKKGLVFEFFRFEIVAGPPRKVLSVTSVRFASMSDPRLLVQELEVACQGAGLQVEVDPAPGIPDFDHRFPHVLRRRSRPLQEGVEATVFMTKDSGMGICVASRLQIDGLDTGFAPFRRTLDPDEPLRLRRWVAVTSSRDLPGRGEGFEQEAIEGAASRKWKDFRRAVEEHTAIWTGFWRGADIRHLNSPPLTQAQRFGLYQVRSVAPRSSEVSVGARGLTGRAYEGHVFWDTEVFTLPIYLAHVPEAARNAILYRHHTLEGARRRARSMGAKGACFAWESTVTGDDVTPSEIRVTSVRGAASATTVPIFTGTQQIHITADVAWSVWKYWQATGDEKFLFDGGGEILLETGRFWASRVNEGPDRRFHIRHVVGPDEYHHGVDDNAFTNWMARANLEYASAFVEWVRKANPGRARELFERVRLGPGEREAWDDVRRRLFVPEPGRDGVIEQFAGFFGLREVRLRRDERLRAPIRRLTQWRETNRVKLIKQADVLMIPFLFPDAFSRDVLEANFRYYEPITDHGSSLSPAVHAAIAARLGRVREARRYFEESLYLDLQDLMRNTALGIHIGNAGGAWQSLILHALGFRFGNGGILPPNGKPAPGFEHVKANLMTTVRETRKSA